MISFDVHSNTCHDKFIKTLFENMGCHLTYVQACHIKEKAKEIIYGQPKNFYKLLPYMCVRIKKM